LEYWGWCGSEDKHIELVVEFVHEGKESGSGELLIGIKVAVA
jgi:hypothetical protein